MDRAHSGQRQVAGRSWPRGGQHVALGVLAVIPILLLVATIVAFATWSESLLGPGSVPADALGKLDVERIAFRADDIAIQIVNSGPAELTVAQVMVNDAMWNFAISPDPEIPRLGRATILVPYPWLEGEPHMVKVVTTNGLAFSRTVPVATATPDPEPSQFLLFALLGLYVGVVPVFLGLLWYPVMRRLGHGVMDFLLAVSAGLLVFLGLEALRESLGLAAQVPEPFRGFGLVAIGAIGAFLALVAMRRKTIAASSGRSEAERRLALAYLIATGIGLHNLGEGLAVGAAYALGELALGAFLVIGFTLHNLTEGFAIVTPVARHGTSLPHLVGLGLIAGGPTVIGTWIGGFTYSDAWATLFLAIGAGAIFQVVLELARLPGREGPGWLLSPTNVAGILAGMGIMYATGLLVAV